MIRIGDDRPVTFGNTPPGEPSPAKRFRLRLPQGRARRIALAAAGLAAAAAVAVGIGLAVRERPVTAEDMARTVVVCDDYALQNTGLNYYFWSEYYYLLENGSLPDSLDASRPLDEQAYDGETSWQDYILDQALATVRSTMSMVFEAEAAGFSLPETYQASMERVLSTLADNAAGQGYTAEDGSADVDGYLAASFGLGATEASFAEYLADSYLGAAYADSLYESPTFTDAELSAYYDQYAADYEAMGVTKDETALRTVRLVLLAPDGDSDEAWDAAQSKAETLLATWQAESGSEADFAALAQAHSADETAADGGLLEHLAPSDLTGRLGDWVFDEARKAGDAAAIRTDEGWALVYYVGQEAATVWQKTAEADLRRETYQNAFLAACDRYTFLVDYDAIRIATPSVLYGGSPVPSESLPAGD